MTATTQVYWSQRESGIKPCPFCGEEPTLRTWLDGRRWYAVRCDCSVMASTIPLNKPVSEIAPETDSWQGWESAYKAILGWNARTSPVDYIDAEELRGILEDLEETVEDADPTFGIQFKFKRIEIVRRIAALFTSPRRPSVSAKMLETIAGDLMKAQEALEVAMSGCRAAQEELKRQD